MNKVISCVVRSHKGNDEYVRIEDAASLQPGERVITARMVSHVIKDGPSDSHRITVWTRRGPSLYTAYGAHSNRSLEERFADFEQEALEAA